MKTFQVEALEWRSAVHARFPSGCADWVCVLCTGVVRHSGPVGIDSRTVALAVLSVVLAVVLGFEAGMHAGAAAGVLAALAGLLPAVVWELTRDRRARNARAARTAPGRAEGVRARRGTACCGRRSRRLPRRTQFCLVPAAGGPGGPVPATAGTEPVAGVVRGRGAPEGAAGDRGGRLGETRLALQLAADLAADGWRTMWVERGQEGTAVSTVRDVGEPAVLVVDYAETRPGLAGLLAQAAAAEDCPDLRVLLLARSAGEWWRQLLDGADYRLSQVLEDTNRSPWGRWQAGSRSCSMTR